MKRVSCGSASPPPKKSKHKLRYNTLRKAMLRAVFQACCVLFVSTITSNNEMVTNKSCTYLRKLLLQQRKLSRMHRDAEKHAPRWLAAP